ncbi:YhjD/YihY/BrkB family envelope integrity protein [Streptomyces sp. NPDC047117]|uniref:YihY/virulence factor BrkB family protein n=1 Tax=unclassified Streptomyces TaxID=2593676 RepID=UPI0033C97E41
MAPISRPGGREGPTHRAGDGPGEPTARVPAARQEAGAAPTPGPDPLVKRREPDELTALPKKSWWAVLRGTVKEVKGDELTDRAAALTYYGVLSLFPALLVLVSLLGLVGESASRKVVTTLQQLAPDSVRQIISNAVQQLQGNAGVGSLIAVVGLLGGVWTASGYVAAFMRSSNVVYDMAEGRPMWKVLLGRLGLTVVLMLLALLSALIVVFTGGIARQVGDMLGVGAIALTVWSIAKWPVLLILVTTMIAILYWGAPNVKGRGLRWVTPGSALALVIWLVASGGFAVYVGNFSSYNKTYGTLAGVIIFLVWLWITNLAILLGLEFDAEMARERAVAGGHPQGDEPYVEPRDTTAWSEEERERAENPGEV